MTDQRTISGVAERLVDVVVVEDDERHRELVVTILSESGCLVRSASSAAAGLELVLERTPDVVVSDLDLGRGGPTGWIFAERLRSGPDTKHIARIAVTGSVEPRVEVVRAFDAYIRKPIDADLLRVLVRQLSSMSRASQRERAAG